MTSGAGLKPAIDALVPEKAQRQAELLGNRNTQTVPTQRVAEEMTNVGWTRHLTSKDRPKPRPKHVRGVSPRRLRALELRVVGIPAPTFGESSGLKLDDWRGLRQHIPMFSCM